ncbi:ABC transporter substrate-binding protein [Nesterenkonia pannonica]|uniref:ABC transporter substrate-binding protein n=1 Tax=Nesterenkonia pannonica TaxID=1548602 RepID=UPI002164634B|nr:ABC transporter substrate-binding protein [Nesterenkonia pannonica]
MTKMLTSALAAAAALALASCGSASTAEENSASEPDELREVTVGAVPVVDVGALYVGLEQGFFEEEGIDLSIEFAQGGAALVPALTNGQYEFIYSNSMAALQARERGLPLVAVAEGGRSTGVEGEDHGGLLVAATATLTPRRSSKARPLPSTLC